MAYHLFFASRRAVRVCAAAEAAASLWTFWRVDSQAEWVSQSCKCYYCNEHKRKGQVKTESLTNKYMLTLVAAPVRTVA